MLPRPRQLLKHGFLLNRLKHELLLTSRLLQLLGPHARVLVHERPVLVLPLEHRPGLLSRKPGLALNHGVLADRVPGIETLDVEVLGPGHVLELVLSEMGKVVDMALGLELVDPFGLPKGAQSDIGLCLIGEH